jgi:predicted P-loop ATPase
MTKRTEEGADSWRNSLVKSATGAPKSLLANAITALRFAPAWTNVLSYDVFLNEAILDAAPPWDGSIYEWQPRPWSPQDDLLATDWLQKQGIGVTSITAAQAVEVVSRDCSFHPVLDYLDGLEHDGKPRLNTWISDYLGAIQTPYNETVGRSMMIAAIARIRDPGCKVDTVPILEGAQGARKSTAVKALFAPWFSDELADLGSKDAAMQTRGVWGIEVSELDAMSRMEVSRVKAFISRTTDRYRPPYGNRIIESPRACVFWGTTNTNDYLKDETGGRRFWPVKAGTIDVDGLHRFRDQLWAEAQVLYGAGVPWWITSADVQSDAEQEQRDRYIGDAWQEAVNRYVSTEVEVTIEKVLRFGLQIEINRCGQPEMNRVARILKTLGYVRRQKGSGAFRRWIYSKPVSDDETSFHLGSVTTLRPVSPKEPVSREEPAGQGQTSQSPQTPVF